MASTYGVGRRLPTRPGLGGVVVVPEREEGTQDEGLHVRQARKGNVHLQAILVEAAWSAVKTSGRLQTRFDRLVRRFGGHRNQGARKKAIFAIAHTMAPIIWHVLHDHAPYTDLGADFHTRRQDPEREKNRLITKLNALGYHVTTQPTA